MEQKEMRMPLVTIIPVIVFIVVGCIVSFIGIRKLRQKRQEGHSGSWYRQTYILMGITSFLLAAFFLLIGLHEMVSEHNTGIRILIYILAGIMLIGAGVSCWYMIRYYPFFPPRDAT
jgi:hypothetical protein